MDSHDSVGETIPKEHRAGNYRGALALLPFLRAKEELSPQRAEGGEQVERLLLPLLGRLQGRVAARAARAGHAEALKGLCMVHSGLKPEARKVIEEALAIMEELGLNRTRTTAQCCCSWAGWAGWTLTRDGTRKRW